MQALIGHEKICAAKGRAIQNNFHLVGLLLEKVDSKAETINLYYSIPSLGLTVFFLKLYSRRLALSCSFNSESGFLYKHPGAMAEVNSVISKPFILSRSNREAFPLSPMLYLHALKPTFTN